VKGGHFSFPSDVQGRLTKDVIRFLGQSVDQVRAAVACQTQVRGVGNVVAYQPRPRREVADRPPGGRGGGHGTGAPIEMTSVRRAAADNVSHSRCYEAKARCCRCLDGQDDRGAVEAEVVE